jgi:two-component system, LuxR family, response regulator FixJ
VSDQPLVAIVDHEAQARASTAAILEQAGYQVGTFESGDTFLAAGLPCDADCVVLGLRMPGTDGIGVLKALGECENMPPVLVLTGHGAIPEAVEAMKLGAIDFLEKPYPADTFLEAVGGALELGPRRRGDGIDPAAVAKVESLSRRQAQVLRGIVSGKLNKTIAYDLGLSIRTVEAYRSQVHDKLGVRGTAEAVRLALAAGML